MGSFNSICAVTRQIISVGEKVKAFPIVSMSYNKEDGQIDSHPGCYVSSRYKIYSPLPLSGEYDDYGRVRFENDGAYKLLMSLLETEYVPNEIEEGKTLDDYNEYHDYMEIPFWQLDIHGDMQIQMSNGRLFVDKRYMKSCLYFMLVKESVYNAMSKMYEDTLTSSYDIKYYKDYIEKAITEIKENSTAIEIDMDSIEYAMEELKTIDKNDPQNKERLDEIYAIMLKYTTSLSSSRSFGMSGIFDSGESSYYSVPNLKTEDYTLLDDNLQDFLDSIPVIRMFNILNIEFIPHAYGSQEYDHFAHFYMMSKLQCLGANNKGRYDEYDIKYSVDFGVHIPEDGIGDFTSGENPDLIYKDGKYIVTDTEYNELSSYRVNGVTIYVSKKEE